MSNQTESLVPSKIWLSLRLGEFAAFFAIGPLVYYIADPGPGWLFPALWAWAVVCVALLLTDRSFAKRQLWNIRACRAELGPMLARFAVLGGALTLATAVLLPEDFLRLPRERPMLWAMIMVFYPLLSVFPQEVVFRAFFFHRYRGLFGGGLGMIAASALAFGYVHIVFGNWLSVALTAVGGALFALTYARSRSTAAASIEHALYGCLVFTIGLGQYFYSGTGG